jgi:hypothetical protein
MRDEFDRVIDLLSSGQLVVADLTSVVTPLPDTLAAFDQLLAGRIVKALIAPSPLPRVPSASADGEPVSNQDSTRLSNTSVRRTGQPTHHRPAHPGSLPMSKAAIGLVTTSPADSTGLGEIYAGLPIASLTMASIEFLRGEKT